MGEAIESPKGEKGRERANCNSPQRPNAPTPQRRPNTTKNQKPMTKKKPINNYKGTPVVGFVGFSGAGKTTILAQVIAQLKLKNLNVAVIKHTHHHFDIDKKGKDSYRFRASGANQVIVGSKKRFALMVELDQEEPDLSFLLSKLDLTDLDMILFEGFKHENYAKIEVHRLATQKPWLYPNDNAIVAIVTDDLDVDGSIPIFGLGDLDGVLGFLLGYREH